MKHPETSVGIGVIGTGGMGSRHARNVHERVIGAHVAGLFDLDQAKAAALAADCGDALVFASRRALIDDERIEAVIIASPNETHAEFTLHCLEAGKRVLCEKPLATTAAEAWRVVETEVALGQRLVTVGFMRRFDPPHTAVKAAVQSGRIGRAYLYKGSHRNQAIPPDFPQSYVISQSAIHDLDAARWLLDQDIKEVYAQGVHVDPAIEANTMDLVLLTMSMMDGALASIEVFLSAQYGYEVTAEVVGERGVLTTLQLDPILVRFDHTRSVAVPSDWLERFAEAYVIEVRQWVNVLRLAQQVGATAWDGYAALLVSDACLASLDSGQPEAVVGPPKPELYL